MANIKKSLDYFPFAVDFFTDRKIKRLQRVFAEKGMMVYIFILAEIYRNDGYFLSWDSDYPDDIAGALGENFKPTLVSEVVNHCVNKFGLFDKELFNTSMILTSKGIQRRYLAIRESILKRALDVKRLFPIYRLIGDDLETAGNSADINGVLRRSTALQDANDRKSAENGVLRREENRIERNEMKKNIIPPLSPQGETAECKSLVPVASKVPVIVPENISLLPIKPPEELNNPRFFKAWREWEKYRKEKRQALKPTTVKKQYDFLAKFDVDVAIKIIEQSIMQGWTGLFELKENRSKKQESIKDRLDNLDLDSNPFDIGGKNSEAS